MSARPIGLGQTTKLHSVQSEEKLFRYHGNNAATTGGENYGTTGNFDKGKIEPIYEPVRVALHFMISCRAPSAFSVARYVSVYFCVQF